MLPAVPSTLHSALSALRPHVNAIRQEIENIASECEIQGIGEARDIETLRILAKQRPLIALLTRMIDT